MFPLAVGNWWIYRTTDAVSGLALECKTNTITGVELTEAGPVYEIEKEDSKPNTSWLLDTGTRLGWTRKLWKDPQTRTESTDDYYDPYMLRLDYGTELLCAPGLEYPARHGKRTIDVETCGWSRWNEDPGACSSESIEVKEVQEHWTVLEPMDCAVKQDRFLCLCVTRDQDGSGVDESQGMFCFARGVGKVFEETELLEELLAYCVEGAACPDPPIARDLAECQ